MEHNWEKYLDTNSEYWSRLQELYKANEHYPKKGHPSSHKGKHWKLVNGKRVYY